MKRMMLLPAMLAAGLMFAPQANAGDSGWVGTSRLVSISRTARAKSEIPVSLDCRNASANPRALKLEVRIATKPNTEKRDWVFFAEDLNYQPGGLPNEWGKWRKISGVVLRAPGSGKAIYCSLFHHKSAQTVSREDPPISARSTAGLRIKSGTTTAVIN